MASVLIVDDEHLLIDCLAEYLEIHGYDVTTATSCEQALRTLEESIPDVLVIDLGLPDGSAVDLVGQIHRKQSGPRAIVISGWDEVPHDLVRYGVDSILSKPFDPETLAAAIRHTLSSPR